jgi:hypothetical protein
MASRRRARKVPDQKPLPDVVRTPNRLKIFAVGAVIVLAGLGIWKLASRQSVHATALPPAPAAADPSLLAGSFGPTIENKAAPSGAAPAGMA